MLRDAVNATTTKSKNGSNVETNHLPIGNKLSNECQHVVICSMATHRNDDSTIY